MYPKALRMLRLFYELSQEELATKLKVPPSYVSMFEAGKRQPSFSVLEKYAEVFELPLSSLIFLAEKIDEGELDDTKFQISEMILTILKVMRLRAKLKD
jgi:transcriptional regulator with XRE-family HTH domain